MISKKKNLADILSGFTKTVDELKALQERNTLDKVKNEDTINSLQIKNSALEKENKCAEKVLQNISKLIDIEDE